MLDRTTEWGQRAENRLQSNLIGWLTTVGSNGHPDTVPVWFLWQEDTVLIFSQPNKKKIRNLHKNPRISLALDNSKDGEDVVVVEGTAELLDSSISVDKLPAYAAKYGTLLKDMGWTTASMAADYSQAIRVTPTKIRSWI